MNIITDIQAPTLDFAPRFAVNQKIDDTILLNFDERHLLRDHVHMCLSVPPKYAVSNVVGYIKGKSAIQIARKFSGRQKNFTEEDFWAREYFVSTVGLDENVVRAYIRNQKEEDERYEQMKLVFG